mmetsp:Transcript_4541/g.5790  ORF Transcript_4541/g.5790 Transcript_4541/m.5790 type:complete len:266 (-) Transcript_4541:192-989(-)|eukprot:CAMPEP_0172508832 /NCGR_PEP_ID=MMETSP1066-20121228/215214_1 /TAXON_ID=671091 /ORGANISM="Coscinodiscus wailesii, Strain CCMP2513" /LENGTH=265 /DNA_ID=CAMNT_0013287017 /DNA_START=103 /DNA_END=900 /DNA_ORIENTATION=+
MSFRLAQRLGCKHYRQNLTVTRENISHNSSPLGGITPVRKGADQQQSNQSFKTTPLQRRYYSTQSQHNRDFQCRCWGPYRAPTSSIAPRHRRLSSSSPSSPPNNVNNNQDDTETTTPNLTPLSEISREDLSLATLAANDETSSSSSPPPITNESFSDIPGVVSGGKKLAIVYTCKVCNTRSAKKFSERAYRHGIVLVRCPGCENLHLVADRLGVFEDEDDGGWDLERYMKRMGEKVTAVTNDNVLELTLKDVLGGEVLPEGEGLR